MSKPAFELLTGDPTTWGVPSTGQVYLGINQSGQIVVVASDGSITPIVSTAPALNNQTNASGTTTISIAAQIQTSALTITGSARTVPVVISEVGPASGATLDLIVNFPPTAGIHLDLRDGSTSGVQIDSFTTDGSVATGIWRLYYDGSGWQKRQVQVPAY